jgi:hypothetical protein
MTVLHITYKHDPQTSTANFYGFLSSHHKLPLDKAIELELGYHSRRAAAVWQKLNSGIEPAVSYVPFR